VPRFKETRPLSALLLIPLIALSLACAPVGAGGAGTVPARRVPSLLNEECAQLERDLHAEEARFNANPNPNKDNLGLQHLFAQFQIRCLGTSRP
jgi:hypothetical protein